MIRNLLAITAAAGLALAPMAAAANTRAGEAAVNFGSSALLERAPALIGASLGQGRTGDEPSDLLLIMLFGAAATGIIVAVESSENKKSPGT